MKDMVWIVYETDCESSWPIGYFLSKESAIQCAKDAYDEERSSREEKYASNPRTHHMLWPKEPVDRGGNGLEFFAGRHYADWGYCVGEEPVEVLP